MTTDFLKWKNCFSVIYICTYIYIYISNRERDSSKRIIWLCMFWVLRFIVHINKTSGIAGHPTTPFPDSKIHGANMWPIWVSFKEGGFPRFHSIRAPHRNFTCEYDAYKPSHHRLTIVPDVWVHTANGSPFWMDGSWPSDHDVQHRCGWRGCLWDRGSLMTSNTKWNSLIIGIYYAFSEGRHFYVSWTQKLYIHNLRRLYERVIHHSKTGDTNVPPTTKAFQLLHIRPNLTNHRAVWIPSNI